MFDVEKKYYYKEVEESASRYANLLSELNTYINSDGLKEQIELFSNIPWHRFSTKYSDVEEANLTDDQKEEIALCRKGWKEEIEDRQNAFMPYLSTVKSFCENICALQDVLNERLATISIYDFDAVKDLYREMPPLKLTSKELYYALTFLEIDQVRALLTEQTPVIFNRILSAFLKGEKEFIQSIDDADYAPMTGLREMLMAKMYNVASIRNYTKESEPILKDLIVEEMCETFNCEANSVTISNGFDFSIEVLLAHQKLFNDVFYNHASCLYHSDLLTISDRQKVLSIYEDWRKCNSSYSPLNDCEPIGLSDRLHRIITNQIDMWILSNIHQCMNQESTQIEDTDNSDGQSIPNIDYRDFYISESPKHITEDSMRDIAELLAGIIKKDGTITHSSPAFIKNYDVSRLCYFFFRNSYSDYITDIDFSQPIHWYGSWQSFKYFVMRLYFYHKPLPPKYAETVVKAFRFDLERERGEEKGQIKEKTFKNNSKPNMEKNNNEINRINNIFKELNPFTK